MENIKEWFAAGALAVGEGSKLCPSAWILEVRFKAISQLESDFIVAVNEARKVLNQG